MQGKIGNSPEKSSRKRALSTKYVSPNQLTLCGFETPFEQQLTKNNRWVKLSSVIPWDKVVNEYNNLFDSLEGRPPISGRIIIGTIIIKHYLELTDRETVAQIQENMFMQYFLGYSSFSNEAPFSYTMLTKIRSKLDAGFISRLNALILNVNIDDEDKHSQNPDDSVSDIEDESSDAAVIEKPEMPSENKGRLLMDTTVAPQNITFPTDLKLLNASREKTERIIDILFDKDFFSIKPRTYRQEARKYFLNTNKKKGKSYKEIYEAVGRQLRYVKRNLGHIEQMLKVYNAQEIAVPLSQKMLRYIDTITLVYQQQHQMHTTRTRTIENRIVSIHQPHVRPIVRGKEGKRVEFGSKIQVSMINGLAFLDKLSWNNFNDGTMLEHSVEAYKKRFGYYPKEVLADKIYCNRSNRAYLKSLNIELRSKPLGRPPKNEALSNQVSPGERNPIEGKFGQSKVGYGMNNIRAKLKNTSESWIATIFMVLNLVKLTRFAPLCAYIKQLLEYKIMQFCQKFSIARV